MKIVKSLAVGTLAAAALTVGGVGQAFAAPAAPAAPAVSDQCLADMQGASLFMQETLGFQQSQVAKDPAGIKFQLQFWLSAGHDNGTTAAQAVRLFLNHLSHDCWV